jgi:hypothetical protein
LSNAEESNHFVIEHKKYVKDQKKVRKDGVETTLYVTAVNGIVGEYTQKSISVPYPTKITCKNKHLGTLQQFEKYWVHKNGYMEC